MPLFASTVIGIQWGEGRLRAVARRSGWHSQVAVVCHLQLPATVIAPDGSITSPKDAGTLLRMELAKGGWKGKLRAAVLLPPERVYTYFLTLPPQLRGKALQQAVRTELKKVVPEEIGRMIIRLQILERSRSALFLGAAVVRREFVEQAAEVMGAAGLRLDFLSSVPSAIASRLEVPRDERTFLLFLPPSLTSRGSLTVVSDLWPLDEAMVQSGVSPEDMTRQVRDLRAEYPPSRSPRSLFFLGEEAWGKTLAGATDLPVRPVVLPVAAGDAPWADLLAFCVEPGAKKALNFASPGGKGRIVIAALALLLVIAGLGVALWFGFPAIFS